MQEQFKGLRTTRPFRLDPWGKQSPMKLCLNYWLPLPSQKFPPSFDVAGSGNGQGRPLPMMVQSGWGWQATARTSSRSRCSFSRARKSWNVRPRAGRLFQADQASGFFSSSRSLTLPSAAGFFFSGFPGLGGAAFPASTAEGGLVPLGFGSTFTGWAAEGEGMGWDVGGIARSGTGCWLGRTPGALVGGVGGGTVRGAGAGTGRAGAG